MKLKSLLLFTCLTTLSANVFAQNSKDKTRVIVLSDAERDDQCSFVRFLLYANEWDVEAIITTSSQYHWHGHSWNGDDWHVNYVNGYEKVQPNLAKHDSRYPTAKYIRDRIFLGNCDAEGEMTKVTPGSSQIVKVLLDETDNRPIWFQAWGGMNTLARALKTIEEQHPEKMAYVASKMRFYFIWEQDNTYQSYILPKWGKYNILTIISDQFIAIFYHWAEYLPAAQQAYLKSSFMLPNIKQNKGALCAAYNLSSSNDFDSEGDSPAYMHVIPTGLRNLENPDWGGWGGRFVKVRNNTWLDPVLEANYKYPSGRWYTSTAWGRVQLRKGIVNDAALTEYLKPQWLWIEALQNDFAARADWCVKPYASANHQPVSKVNGALDRTAAPGQTVSLDASTSTDPDGNTLSYKWWQYEDADNATSKLTITNNTKDKASFVVPNELGKQLHVILEVTDNGIPALKSYQRVIVTISSTTSLDDENTTQKVSIYPNPSTGYFNINLPNDATIQLFDLEGVMVEEHKNVSNITVGENLKSGVYFLKTNTKVYKLIKE
jgi:hypothetical protein